MEKVKKLLFKILNWGPFFVFMSLTRNNPLVIHIHRFLRGYFVDIILGLIFLPFSLLCFLFIRIRYLICKKKIYGIVGIIIVKNEGRYIKELVDYYRLINFDKLYIFDNGSTDNTESILQPYINNNFVKYIRINGKARQRDTSNLFFWRYGHKCIYAAFFDADEFLKIKSNDALADIQYFFDKYHALKIGSLAVSWQVFGTSGYKTKQDGGVIETFIKRPKDDFHMNVLVKSIVIPKAVFSFYIPHYPYLMPRYKALSTNGMIVKGASNVFTNDGILFFHYYTKSSEEYLSRHKNGNAFTGGLKPVGDLELIDKDNIVDTSLRDYVEKRKNTNTF